MLQELGADVVLKKMSASSGVAPTSVGAASWQHFPASF